MASFLETVRKSDNARRYYVGGCRVTRSAFIDLGTGDKSCFLTIDTGTHWRHYHERAL